MKSSIKLVALATLTAMLAAGNIPTSADAKGFHRGGGHGFGHKFGGGHKFVGGHKFGFGHHNCWRFGKWICGSGSY